MQTVNLDVIPIVVIYGEVAHLVIAERNVDVLFGHLPSETLGVLVGPTLSSHNRLNNCSSA